MCAMLSVVAAKELRIEPLRVVRFLESYIGLHAYRFLCLDLIPVSHSCIDVLTRLRLYTSAACLRKYSKVEEIDAATRVSCFNPIRTSGCTQHHLDKLETIIYTSCGRCRKPIMFPAGTQKPNDIRKGGYSFCLACKTHFAKCSIWYDQWLAPSLLTIDPGFAVVCLYEVFFFNVLCVDTEAIKNVTDVTI